MRLARLLALLAAAWMFASLAWVIAHRVAYPFDLEWLEGATLWHAQRLAEGLPLYPPPTIDFVPHPYPPLYPVVVALLSHVTGGVSYWLGRTVSTVSFIGALAVGWSFVRSEGGSRVVATAAMAIPCAAYAAVGSWYDLVRVDSLWLLLTAAGVTLAWQARRSTLGVVEAALLLVAAFFTKQTAAPFIVAVAVGLAIVEWRGALVFGAVIVVVALAALWVAQRVTGGWFWFYIFRVHQSHRFVVGAALVVPARLAILLLPSVALATWALMRHRSPALWWTAFLAATGIAISSVGKATEGGYINAFVPGIYFWSLFVGVATARLVAAAQPIAGAADRRATIAWALVAATILLAPRVLPRALQAVAPRLYDAPQTSGYRLASLMPSTQARSRDEALVARLRAVIGEVWLPTRPWYARLAGKRPLAGEMGAVDVTPTGATMAGLQEALLRRRFAAVVVDEPHESLLDPVFRRSTVNRFDGAPALAGIRRLSWWLTPR